MACIRGRGQAMNILLTGAAGQRGKALRQLLEGAG
jgi:dTDP-4-dehydrorhamnose reductase